MYIYDMWTCLRLLHTLSRSGCVERTAKSSKKSLKSDIGLNAHLFAPEAMLDDVNRMDTHRKLMEMGKKCPPCHEIGAPKYRDMRVGGDTPFPKSIGVESGEDSSLPSREKGRHIPIRIFRLSRRDATVEGVLLYNHGGDFFLHSETCRDPLLKESADNGIIIVFGYSRTSL